VALIVVGFSFLNHFWDINDAYMVVVGGCRRRAPGIVIRSPPRTPEPDTNSDTSVESEERDPTFGQDVIGLSQLGDAPLGTQATPPKRQTRGSVRMWAAKMS
jgi:hypothetical protein